jgi:hypothetical protein
MNRTLLSQLVVGLSVVGLGFGATIPAQAQTSFSHANSDPWFEIELIAFERGSLSSTLEQFDKRVTAIPVHRSLDLLKPLYQPDIRALQSALPSCQDNTDSLLAVEDRVAGIEPQPWFDEIQLAEQQLKQYAGAFPAAPLLQWPLSCRRNQPKIATITDPMLYPQEADTQVDGPSLLPVVPQPTAPVQHQPTPYLLDETAFQLKDLAWQLGHRAGHKLLLHTAWRQSLGVKRRSTSLRFFAGQRFSPKFDYQGLLKTERSDMLAATPDLQAAIEKTYQQLQQAQQLSRDEQAQAVYGLPQQVWQLDGIIQPYNERMLFADTEFNLRQLVSDTNNIERLNTFYVKDSVRLLLGEIHYLDHPRFGLILQIRRFTPPATPVAGEGVTP